MLIVIDSKHARVSSAFRQLGSVRFLETREISSSMIRDADALVVRSETRVDEALLDGTRIRFVGTATIGTDHVDLSYLKRRGIGFASAPGSNANSVAEYIAASLLILADRFSIQLRGTTIGIVGIGNIGSRVERIARALGMRVLANDPPLQRATGDPRFVPLDDLLQADIITLHVPLTRDGDDVTYHLFEGRRIRSMKRGSILLNTSRGSVVETRALAQALRSGNLAGAVIDVWEDEPALDRELLSLTTLATPHIAGYSFDGRLNAAKMIYDALCSYSGLSVPWRDPEDLPPPAAPVLRLPENLRTLEETLWFAVRRCYDIERDDRSLKATLERTGGDAAELFRNLRAQYPVRREFSATHLEIPAMYEASRPALGALGFSLR
jgi:erythronate-4-phosphate dehydrogenase